MIDPKRNRMERARVKSDEEEAAEIEDSVDRIFTEIHEKKTPSELDMRIKGLAARIGFRGASDPEFARNWLNSLFDYMNDFPLKDMDKKEILKKLEIQQYITEQVNSLPKVDGNREAA